MRADAEQMVGGAEALQTIMEHAGKTMRPEQIAAINSRLSDRGQYRGAVADLIRNYADAVGGGSAAPGGSSGGGSGSGPASNITEFQRLLREANAGDSRARARIDATDPETVRRWVG